MLPYDEIGPFFNELRANNATSARLLEFTILTAARTGDSLYAAWPEFDLSVPLWTFPAERTKAKREHRVPLSSSVVTLLKALPTFGGAGLVFEGFKEGKRDARRAVISCGCLNELVRQFLCRLRTVQRFKHAVAAASVSGHGCKANILSRLRRLADFTHDGRQGFSPLDRNISRHVGTGLAVTVRVARPLTPARQKLTLPVSLAGMGHSDCYVVRFREWRSQDNRVIAFRTSGNH